MTRYNEVISFLQDLTRGDYVTVNKAVVGKQVVTHAQAVAIIDLVENRVADDGNLFLCLEAPYHILPTQLHRHQYG